MISGTCPAEVQRLLSKSQVPLKILARPEMLQHWVSRRVWIKVAPGNSALLKQKSIMGFTAAVLVQDEKRCFHQDRLQ